MPAAIRLAYRAAIQSQIAWTALVEAEGVSATDAVEARAGLSRAMLCLSQIRRHASLDIFSTTVMQADHTRSGDVFTAAAMTVRSGNSRVRCDMPAFAETGKGLFARRTLDAGTVLLDYGIERGMVEFGETPEGDAVFAMDMFDTAFIFSNDACMPDPMALLNAPTDAAAMALLRDYEARSRAQCNLFHTRPPDSEGRVLRFISVGVTVAGPAPPRWTPVASR